MQVRCRTIEDNDTPNARYDSRCELDIEGGGIQEAIEEHSFTAPEGGYAASEVIDMPKTLDPKNWASRVTKNYWLRFPDNTFAKIQFRMIARGDHFAVIEGFRNQITAGEAELLIKLMNVCIEKGHRPREKPPLIWLRKGGLGEHIQYEVLETAGLIDINLGNWMMNKMGWALMRAVGEYPLESKSPDGLVS